MPLGRLDFAALAIPADAGPATGSSVIIGEEESHPLMERRLFAGTIAAGGLFGGWGKRGVAHVLINRPPRERCACPQSAGIKFFGPLRLALRSHFPPGVFHAERFDGAVFKPDDEHAAGAGDGVDRFVGVTEFGAGVEDLIWVAEQREDLRG